MKRKNLIIPFCAITPIIVAFILSKRKRNHLNSQKVNIHPNDAVLIGEKVEFVPIVVFDEQ